MRPTTYFEDDLFEDSDNGKLPPPRPVAPATITPASLPSKLRPALSHSALYLGSRLRVSLSSGCPTSHGALCENNDKIYENRGENLYGVRDSGAAIGLNTFRYLHNMTSVATEAAFGALEYPASAYNHPDKFFEGAIAYGDTPMSMTGMLPSRVMPPQTNNYNVNLLEDADDPFGDDDSLFSDTDDQPMRRATTIGHNSGNQVHFGDDEDFKPRLNYTKTIKRAKLVHGNYVIDAPVPQRLLQEYASKQFGRSNETSFVRYSGVTCGPSNFVKLNYNLRQNIYSPPRATEIMVCITMYNEDEILLGRTLKGVFDNIENLTQRANTTWGDELWKKVTVVIVNDGRLQLHERTQSLLTALGVFQEGYAKSKVSDRDVKAHVFEYTTTVGIEKVTRERVHLAANATPMQLIFALKEKNARKINSHRWCFQAFAPLLQPKVVMLLDCGTKPSKDAFYHLWSAFRDPNVAGACGEMRVALGPGSLLLANPLVAAQNFEYKISNVLDKPMESVFGFISVLPGAFSAYRWDALLNVDGKGPLEKYFKGEFLHQTAQMDVDDDEHELRERNYQDSGIFTSNMYLAEDRILCFELVAKRNKNYVLRYVSSAKAETDVPELVDDLVLQRRRWLNGSLFTAMYYISHWTQIWRSNHSLFRKLWLQLEFYYNLVTVTMSWFSPASFFLVFRILTRNLGSEGLGFGLGHYLSTGFLWIYVGCVVCTFLFAFGNTPRGSRKFYVAIFAFFAVLMAYLLFAAVYLAIETIKMVLRSTGGHFSAGMLFTNSKFRNLVVSMLSTYLLYAIGAVLHGEPSFMFTSFLQYLLISPAYINVLNIYAFCNIHDVSWGNRDAPQAKDLDAAKVTDVDGEMVMTIASSSPEELEDAYRATIEDLRVPPPKVRAAPHKKDKIDSYYALIRTVTVLVWMLTNAILVAVVMAAGGKLLDIWNDDHNATVFLTVILWIVCALAAFRLLGSVIYVLLKMGRPLRWQIQKRKTIK